MLVYIVIHTAKEFEDRNHDRQKSDNQLAAITMEDLPHLFVSWSEPEALSDFYRDLLEQLIPKRNAGILEMAVCLDAAIYMA